MNVAIFDEDVPGIAQFVTNSTACFEIERNVIVVLYTGIRLEQIVEKRVCINS